MEYRSVVLSWCKYIVLFFCTSLSFGVYAYCDAVGNFTIPAGDIQVQRDAVIGQPISEWIYSNEAAAYQNCNYDTESISGYAIESGIKSYNSQGSGMTYDGKIVFNTNLAGVGFILEGDAKMSSDPWTGWKGITSSNEVTIAKLPNRFLQRPAIGNRAKIKFIKTGNITSGILSGDVGKFFAGTRENNAWSNEVPITFSSGSISQVACSVVVPVIPVELNNHAKSEFSGVGSGTQWQNFTIDLQCNVGTKVNIRFEGNADPVNVPGVLKLDSASGDMAATGVGVQIYYRPDDSAVVFGDTKYYAQAIEERTGIQMKARYYQTKNTITPGVANATATFTLSFK
ncbi:fimbrial protein [Entomohabitans teleogrylli]|uniref:fimbrial protein n=1 Tax=Entomohabitans teleogrylli TaxID=1384589 RepID=UPI00073D9333|nr:fimbrial protein [Entomohabitans teleogrylli]